MPEDEDDERALAAARAYGAMGRPARARSVLEQALAGAKTRGEETKGLREALERLR